MSSDGDKNYSTYDNLVKDDGSGEVKVWRIQDFDKVPVDEKHIGHFFDGDSYIVLYTYKIDEEVHHIIYFWQGRHSTIDERGTSALLTVELDENMGGKPVQVRVAQGREPPHFRAVFAGRMIVHAGGKASGFRNRNDEDEIDDDGVRLYHVKGTTPIDTYACYVTEASSSLNSRDCFILCNDEEGAVYLWKGNCSLPAVQDVAYSIAEILTEDKMSLTTINEGDEPSEFWEKLGGEGEYATQRPDEPQPSEPRLFHCSDALGEMKVSEVSPFSQDDLDTSDVMILDCGTSIYIWVGSGSNEEEQQAAMDIGMKYAASREEGEIENRETLVATVQSGSEPSFFTQHFIGWDPKFLEKRSFIDPLELKEAERRREEAEEEESESPFNSKPFVDPLERKEKVQREQDAEEEAANALTDPTPEADDENPSGDPTKKEETLSDAEFVETFGMDRESFYSLKGWKQVELKKKAGLF